jgi:hypothetical protein
LSRAELIAILRRLRVGDEQQQELEELCVRLRAERRQIGAHLRRSRLSILLAGFVVGRGVAASLVWGFGRAQEVRVSIDWPSPSLDSSAELHASEAENAAMPPDVYADADADADADVDAPAQPWADPEPAPEQSMPTPPPIIARSKPHKRDCKAIAKELAQVLTNDAPRADQCDEDGFMAVRVGTDGRVTTSGPLRGYAIEDGKSCERITVKCPANW